MIYVKNQTEKRVVKCVDFLIFIKKNPPDNNKVYYICKL